MKSQPVSSGRTVALLAQFLLAAVASQVGASQPILSGETNVGSILAPGGFDSWTFAGSAGDRIVVAAVRTSGALDTDIYLDAPGGGVETHTHGGFGGGDRLDHQLLTTGTYALRIQDWSLTQTGAYSLTLMKIPGSLNSASDPDGGAIVSGQTVAGTVNAASDLDGFTFTGTSGDRVLVTAVALSGTLDTDLYLYPAGGGSAVAATHGGFGGGDRLELQLPSTGTFTIMASDWSLTNSGVYAITFLSMSAAATTLHPGESTSGSIDIKSDLEAYQFSGSPGDRVILAAVATGGGLDTDLYLYPPHGAAAIATGHGGFGGGDRIECRLDSTGTYTLVVADWSLQQTGTYALTFVQMPGVMTYGSDSDGGPIPMGASFSGQMQVASDLDAFQFYAGAGTRVLVSAVRESGTLDTDLYLYPPGGDPAVASTHGGFGGGDFLEFQITTTGVQTLVVEDWSLEQTGSYSLTYLKMPGSVSWTGDRDGGLIRIEGLGFPAFPASPNAGIDVRGDLDAFEFWGRSGDRMRISCTTASGSLDTDLFLYPPGGGPAEATSHGGFGGGDVLERQLTSEGLYTIVVRDWSLAQTGDYTIRLYNLSGGDLAPGLYGPQPPMGGRVYAQGGNHFAWDPVAGATSYDVYLGTDVTTPLQLLTTTTLPRADLPVLVPADAVWYWRVIATTPTRTFAGSLWWFASSSDPTDAPAPANAAVRVVLYQNEPNPFNPSTRIRFELTSPGEARLAIYDVAGRLVRVLVDGAVGSGERSVMWDGRDAHSAVAASGVYLCRLTTPNGDAAVRRMLLVR